MSKVDTVINARWVIPVDAANSVIERSSVALSENRIHSILPTENAQKQFGHAKQINLLNHALIPGLINAHTHAAMTLFRGAAEDVSFTAWLQKRIWPLESQWVTPEFVSDGSRLAMAEMIRSGVTCMNDMYMFPDVVGQLAQGIGMRVCIGMIVLEFPTAWANSVSEYLNKGTKLRERFSDEKLVSVTLAPHAPYTISDHTFAIIVGQSEQYDLPVHIHVHETKNEINDSVKQYGVRPIERLRQLGLLNSKLIAVHAAHLTDSEINLLHKNQCSVVHCPKSNLKLATGVCPIATLQHHNINVAIGTDGAASNNSLNIIEELRFASLLAKYGSGDASNMTVHETLRMATINGARCLGLESSIGSLAAGKLADITAIDLKAISTVPIFDPVAQIVYAAQRDQVSDVWINGRRVLSDRQLTTIDETECIATARRWQEKINSNLTPLN